MGRRVEVAERGETDAEISAGKERNRGRERERRESDSTTPYQFHLCLMATSAGIGVL